MRVKQEDFYHYTLEEIVDKFYNGDIATFSIELTKKLDKELEELKAKYGEELFKSDDEEVHLSDNSEEFHYEEQSVKLPKELEREIYRKIEFAEEMQRANGNRYYSKEEAFALIFGEDYLNGTLPR